MLRYFVISACVILIILLARHLTVMRFLAASASDLIFHNIYVGDIHVGGMQPEKAQKILQESAGLDRKMIGFIYNDSLVYSLTFADFGAGYDFRVLVDKAFLHGRVGARRDRYNALRILENEPYIITGEPIFKYDERLIPIKLEAVRNHVAILPVNASMQHTPDGFIITDGISGRTPDMQKASDALRGILSSKEEGRITLEMYTIYPTYNARHFENAKSLLGSFTTNYPGGEEIARSVNIRLAAAHINNTVMYPGDVFSTRDAVGPFTPDRGYAMAAVIVDGQLVEDYGGGICQVASTLYNAVLYAELYVMERANHSLKVFYMDFGFDAAIAGDYMDLKFKNNLEYPILVRASAQNGYLEVRIYGHETRPPTRTLAFVSERLEVIPPSPERVLLDENLPSGHVLVNTEPRDGYRYELFRLVFVDGEQVERHRVNTSVYRPVQGVITRGP